MKFFTIPVGNLGDASQELEQFLASHRILNIHRQFVQDGDNSAWCFCVDYEKKADNRLASTGGTSKKDRIDYREVLSPSEFAVFSRIRDLRKELAAQQGVALYAVFKNSQLAALVQQRVRSKEQMLRIDGVGQGRVDKYGQVFLETLQRAWAEQQPAAKTANAA